MSSWLTGNRASFRVSNKDKFDKVLVELLKNYKESTYIITNYRGRSINHWFDLVLQELSEKNKIRNIYWSMKYKHVLNELEDTVYTINKYGFKPFIWLPYIVTLEPEFRWRVILKNNLQDIFNIVVSYYIIYSMLR